MTDIMLHNSATRRKERLIPVIAGQVSMYVCGPTVYERAHLGNARPAVVFDTLFRLLRKQFGAEAVTYVRNFTDVEDKINARAAETGRAISDLTDETIVWYLDDMGALGVLEPTHMPRASAYISEMVSMIETLISRGHAYEAEGHVLFSVDSYSLYGRLSGRSVDDMIAGARVEVAPYKKNPMDFVLWKPSSGDVPGWDSPWGFGRPGWHIECSAMSRALLGEVFDIHGGGNDLTFPHHENEIAQSRCAHPKGEFARVWIHNEMLQVDGKKMSKSLGNFFTVRDLLDQDIAGGVIRFVILSTHYRKPMDWTARKAADAATTLGKWGALVTGIEPAPSAAPEVIAALADDLNTPGAIAALHALAAAGRHGELKASLDLLGVALPDQRSNAVADETAALIDALVAQRAEARAARDFTRADALRDAFAAAGVIVTDTPDGAQWATGPNFDPAKLEGVA
ncbi:MAG: cysteine--tRNA ligase [Pseudomonadota bacterium]